MLDPSSRVVTCSIFTPGWDEGLESFTMLLIATCFYELRQNIFGIHSQDVDGLQLYELTWLLFDKYMKRRWGFILDMVQG